MTIPVPPTRVFAWAIVLVAFLNIAFGVIWIGLHVPRMQPYGDSIEYLNLAKSLKVDQYRTVLYPAFLGVADAISALTSGVVSIVTVANVLQLLISLGAIVCFTFVVIARLMPRLSSGWLLLTAASVWSNPLVAHFNVSIFPDSLSASLTLVLLACIAMVLDRLSPSRAAALVIVATLLALSRSEKALLLVAIALALVPMGLITSGRAGWTNPHRFIAISGLLLVATVISFGMKTATTTINDQRPPFSAANLVFSRVAWPNLTAAHPHLPPDIQAAISLDQAKAFDRHHNNVYPFLVDMAKRPDGDRIRDGISRTVIDTMPGSLAVRIAWDFTKYAVAPLAFAAEAARVVKRSIATNWTLSRMTMFYPVLTWIFLAIGWISLFLFQIPCALRIRCFSEPIVLVIAALILANAAMFALFHAVETHVRYAMPSYILISAFLSACSIRFARPFVTADQAPRPA